MWAGNTYNKTVWWFLYLKFAVLFLILVILFEVPGVFQVSVVEKYLLHFDACTGDLCSADVPA